MVPFDQPFFADLRTGDVTGAGEYARKKVGVRRSRLCGFFRFGAFRRLGRKGKHNRPRRYFAGNVNGQPVADGYITALSGEVAKFKVDGERLPESYMNSL
jgi:hypothetical protein